MPPTRSVIIIGAIAELERSLIVERVRAGMRRARLEGQHIGRQPLVLDSADIQEDRRRGQSLREIAKGHRISTATVQRVLHKHAQTAQEHAGPIWLRTGCSSIGAPSKSLPRIAFCHA
jgi:DNA invertase Pin-like site-specific DNA recombinase